ncbi:MAG: apolipoprotein N-acyltransferase, partial [Nitrosomonas sp.]
MHTFPLSLSKQAILILVSWVLIGFGQPAWYWWLGIIGAAIGLALFWRVLLCYEAWRPRLILATCWYAVVTAVHFSWASSHPYPYIYGVTAAFCLLGGLQFSLFSLLITTERLRRPLFIVVGASVWTLCEWSRLFFMSGYTWNPVGLLLTGNIYSLQTASLWGIFGLTFWITATNLLALRTWIYPP